MRRPPKWTEFFRYPVITGTVLLSVGVTVAWWAKLDVSKLFESAMISRGEFWRLLTSMFPHVSALHLIFNIYWLWVFGTLVEEIYGASKTMGLILLFAVGPNALEYGFASGGVGLSGVGYGLFGLLWILSRRDERFRDAIDNRTIQLFVGWFFFCVVLTYTNVVNVGNIAHGAGAFLGILIGWAITLPEHRPVLIGSITVLIAFGLWAATLGRPKVNLSQSGGDEEFLLGSKAVEAKHDEEALRWLRRGVSYRHPRAGCWAMLGLTYYRLQDIPDALSAYRKAADMGDDYASYTLGSLYDQGVGVPKDAQQAVKLYRKAADHGYPYAMNNLAWAYATSSDPAIHNPDAALKYATQAVAAEKDHPNPGFLDTLAEAHYASGHYQEAVETELQAINLASQEEKDGFQKSLTKYRLAAGDVGKHKNSQHL